MPGGKGNILPSDRTKGFDSVEGKKNINKEGPKSLLTELKSQFTDGVNEVRVPLKNVVIDKEGGFAILKLMTPQAIVLKLNKILAKGNDSNVLRAINLILDRTHGKAHQSVSVETEKKEPRVIEFVTIDNNESKNSD